MFDNPVHIAILVVIVLLVFGAKRLPEIGRSLGSGMREFKEGVTSEAKSQPALPAEKETAETPAAAAPQAPPVETPAPKA